MGAPPAQTLVAINELRLAWDTPGTTAVAIVPEGGGLPTVLQAMGGDVSSLPAGLVLLTHRWLEAFVMAQLKQQPTAGSARGGSQGKGGSSSQQGASKSQAFGSARGGSQGKASKYQTISSSSSSEAKRAKRAKRGGSHGQSGYRYSCPAHPR